MLCCGLMLHDFCIDNATSCHHDVFIKSKHYKGKQDPPNQLIIPGKL